MRFEPAELGPRVARLLAWLWADRMTIARPREGAVASPTPPHRAWAAASPRLVFPTSAAAAEAGGSGLIGRILG